MERCPWDEWLTRLARSMEQKAEAKVCIITEGGGSEGAKRETVQVESCKRFYAEPSMPVSHQLNVGG